MPPHTRVIRGKSLKLNSFSLLTLSDPMGYFSQFLYTLQIKYIREAQNAKEQVSIFKTLDFVVV
jgi:hypothetical protein